MRFALRVLTLAGLLLASWGPHERAADAATFDVQPRSIAVSEDLTFTITSEGDQGNGFVAGAELPIDIRINGPCIYQRLFFFTTQNYGIDFTIAGLFGFDTYSPCFSRMRPGSYVASLDYYRANPDLTATIYQIDIPFTVFGDSDGDGIRDPDDNCPSRANPLQEDTDEDGTGDACDPDFDRDGDGVANGADNCPDVANGPAQANVDGVGNQRDSDGDRLGDACDPEDNDRDNDGVEDAADNCPDAFNPGQEDENPENGTGDACDNDPDLDGVPSRQNGFPVDNCPRAYNPGQEDGDHNGFGDACDDPDDDDDGLADDVDNCPQTPNPDQTESDVPPDGAGDACDPPDTDGDNVNDAIDNCPVDPNPGQIDTDGDGRGDECDSDYDPDGDGIGANDDNCTFDANPDQRDANSNGIGDACDRFSDSDGDGLSDRQEYQLGTDPSSPDPLAPGTNTYTDGQPIGSGNPGMIGQPIGVAISPPGGVDAVAVTVTDPAGNVAFADTLIPQSPVVFTFTPATPGHWTIAADLWASGMVTVSLSTSLTILDQAAPEDCENCVDDNGDQRIDREDTDCAPPANGGGAGVAGIATRKAIDKCSKALQKAGTKLAVARFTLASTCLRAAATCVQTKSGDPTCPAAAGAACTKALGKLPRAETALDTAVLKVCSAPGVAPDDHSGTLGIGFVGETDPCTRRGVVGIAGITQASECVRRQHACAVDRLLAAAVPRAAELLTRGGRNVAAEFPCLSDGGNGGGAGVAAAKRAALRKCDDTLQKAMQKLLDARLKTVQSCTRAVFHCLQVKGEDPSCLTKTRLKCAKAIGTLPSLDAVLVAAVTKSCSAAPLEIDDLIGLQGLGFGALAGRCSALGIASLASVGDLASCLTRQLACRAEQMLENQTPRLVELIGAGGQTLP